MRQLDGKQVREAAVEFMESEFGRHYLATMSLKYNSLHQDAEQEGLSAEQKAFKVERAAGLKMAIDYFSVRKGLRDEQLKAEQAARAAEEASDRSA